MPEPNDHPGRAPATSETPVGGAPPAAPPAGTTAAGAAPPAAAPPAAPPAVPPPGQPVRVDDIPEEALKPRLARERAAAETALLKKLGVSKPEELDAIATELKERREKEKTEAQKAAEATQKLTEAEQKLASNSETINFYAQHELKQLTAEQQTAVKQLAGDDGASQLRAIAALRPTWGATAGVTAPPGSPPGVPNPIPVPPPMAPVVPATTAVPPGAPAPAAAQPPDPRKEYERLSSKDGNPFLAAMHAQQHSPDVIYGRRT